MFDEAIETKKLMINGLINKTIDSKVYEEDISFALLGHSNLDYLEYASGELLISLAENGLKVIDNIKSSQPDPINPALFLLRDKTSSIFLGNLIDLLNVTTLSKIELSNIINTSRKYLGSFVEKDKLAKLLQLIVSHKDIFVHSNPILYIHSGGFTPFAHSGHIEAVKHFSNAAIASYQDAARVVLWTYEKNKFKDHKLRPFSVRIQDIHRVFHNINTVSVFNYPGTTDGEGQAIMYKMLAQLSDNNIRYCIGSDSFIKRMQLLKDNDQTTCLTMQLPNIHFYISLRADTDIKALNEAITYAKSQKKGVTLVGIQTKVFSGTMLREMAETNAQLYTEGLWFQAENSLV
jgi:hypothetical protein